MRNVRFRQNKETARKLENQLQLLCFRVGKEWFSANILGIQEIIIFSEYTQLPNTSTIIEGFVRLREELVPIIDLNKRFHGRVSEKSVKTKVIVTNIEKSQRKFIIDAAKVGFLVDEVTRVVTVAKSQIAPFLRVMNQVAGSFVTGVIKQDNQEFLLLDLPEVLVHNKKNEILNLLSDDEKQELVNLITQKAKGKKTP